MSKLKQMLQGEMRGNASWLMPHFARNPRNMCCSNNQHSADLYTINITWWEVCIYSTKSGLIINSDHPQFPGIETYRDKSGATQTLPPVFDKRNYVLLSNQSQLFHSIQPICLV